MDLKRSEKLYCSRISCQLLLNFVKALNKEGERLKYLRQVCQLSEAILKEEILVPLKHFPIFRSVLILMQLVKEMKTGKN